MVAGTVYLIDEVPTFVRGLVAILQEQGFDCVPMSLEQANCTLANGRLNETDGSGAPAIAIIVVRGFTTVQVMRSGWPNGDRLRGVALVAGHEQQDVASHIASLDWVWGIYSWSLSGEGIAMAVRQVMQGHYGGDPSLISIVSRAPARFHGLSETELGWLMELAAGRNVSALAYSEGWSEPEMYRRLKSLYNKIGARSRTEALLLFTRQKPSEPSAQKVEIPAVASAAGA